MDWDALVIEVDWNRDGVFGDADEDITELVLNGNYFTGRDSASYLTARASAGKLRLELDNQDNKFNPFNTTSIYYGALTPGALVRVTMEGTVKWIGRLASIIPRSDSRIRTATLEAVGILAEMANHRIPPLVSQGGDYTGNLVAEALDAAAAGFDTSGIEQGDVFTGPIGSTQTETDLLAELRKLEEVEFGFLREDTASYRLRFHSRTSRATALTPLAVFADSPSESLHFDRLEEADWLQQIYNRCIAGVSPWSALEETVVWSAAGPYQLSPGETLTVTANPSTAIAEYLGHSHTAGLSVDPPNVAEVTTTDRNTNSLTHSVSNPPVVNAGDLLVLIWCNDMTGYATTPYPSGYARIDAIANATIEPNAPSLTVFAKRALGTEGGTSVTITLSESQSGACHCYRIPAGVWYDTGGTIDGISLYAPGASNDRWGNDVNPEPAPITWPWGAVPTLLIAIAACDAGVATTSYPAGYSGGINNVETLGGSLATCWKQVSGVTSDPVGTFLLASAQEWTAWCIAVRGVSSGETVFTESDPSDRDPTFEIDYELSVGGNPQLISAIEVTGIPMEEADAVTVQADYLPTQDPLTGVGIRTYQNPAMLFRNASEADSYAELVVLHFGEARPWLTGTFVANAPDANTDAYRDLDVNDRITVTASSTLASGFGMGIDEDFVIEAIDVTIGPFIEVTLHLSPAFLTDPFILDESLLDGINLLI